MLGVGGVLHTHTMMTPIDFLIQDASYRDGLYICQPANHSELVQFKYGLSEPADEPNCRWELVAIQRNQTGAQQFDAHLRRLFSLYTDQPQGIYSNELKRN